MNSKSNYVSGINVVPIHFWSPKTLYSIAHEPVLSPLKYVSSTKSYIVFRDVWVGGDIFCLLFLAILTLNNLKRICRKQIGSTYVPQSM